MVDKHIYKILVTCLMCHSNWYALGRSIAGALGKSSDIQRSLLTILSHISSSDLQELNNFLLDINRR